MKKPHVLFVTEKYCDNNPQWLSNSHHNLFGSLECSGLADYSNFFMEEHLRHLDDRLITYHRRLSPDITIVTILPSYNFTNNPSDKAFETMASRGPVVFIWFDLVHQYIYSKAKSLERVAALHVVLDNPFFVPSEKFLHLWTPQDTRIYNNPNFHRQIDVSFMGSMNGYLDRTECVNHLMMHSHAHVHRDGGQREHNLSPQDYARVMQQSKISLSFSKNKGGQHQTKGRLWEVTLCGAMLMEDDNQGTGLWFEPFKDYVPFVSKEDLVEKVNYYLSQPAKLAEIAANGNKKAEMHYSPKNWWRTVFERCGVQTSIT